MQRVVIRGTGHYVPQRRLTNEDLTRMVDTTDEWILSRTGISERRIAAPEEATSDLALAAARAALEDAGMAAQDLDLILVATVSGDYPFPAVACLLHHQLGCLPRTAAFDVSATCVGFLTALQVAEQYIRCGTHKNILVIGAEVLSRFTDYEDLGTCILFSDGAGAAILSRGEEKDGAGILHTLLRADGQYADLLYIPGGGSREPAGKNKMAMDGNKIFKLAVNAMTQAVKEALAATNLTIDDIDWVVPHQANQRIIDAVARHLSLPMDKVVCTVREYGNNSAATIPLAFDLAIKEGKIQRGQKVLLTAFGGGLVWGAAILEY